MESRYESSMLTFMLTLERPSGEQLRHHGRGQRYSLLKQSASEIRERLVEWIDANGLATDVVRVSQPTVFNTLFVTSTPRAAEQLSHAPGVVGVAPTGAVDVELLSTEDQEAATAGDAEEAPSPDEQEGGDPEGDYWGAASG
jgi:hypothetical protein